MNMFKPTTAKSVAEYFRLIDEPRRSEMKKIHAFILKTVPNLKPFLISGMIGYGKFHYKSQSGREGDWAILALGSQKNYISVYVCAVNAKGYIAEQHRKDFPKANIGRSCIRFSKLADIDLPVLGKVLKEAAKTGGSFSV
jgi:hypothetical protein